MKSCLIRDRAPSGVCQWNVFEPWWTEYTFVLISPQVLNTTQISTAMQNVDNQKSAISIYTLLIWVWILSNKLCSIIN